MVSPKTGNIKAISGKIADKVGRQADNVVVNLDDSTIAPDQLASELSQANIPGAKDIYIVKNGSVIKVRN